MIPAFNRDLGRRISKYECVSLARDNRLAVKYGLRQALYAIIMAFQNIFAELVRKRRCLPEQDQGREQPGR